MPKQIPIVLLESVIYQFLLKLYRESDIKVPQKAQFYVQLCQLQGQSSFSLMYAV